MKNLVIIDANALIHRSFHALPPLTTPEGEPIGAVYGTARIILKMLREMDIEYIVACFDLAEPTFRHKEYEEYKAKRIKTPDDLGSQFSLTKELFNNLGIKIYEKAGFEADDLIATITEKLKKENVKILIATGDLDTLQLVENDKVVVYTLKKGVSETTTYNEEAVRERYGIGPELITDLKGIKGDPSDNIIGVVGIGEKGAINLIKKFGKLEDIYNSIESPDFKLDKEIPKGVYSKLIEQKEQAFFSKYLATVKRDVDIEVKLNELKFKGLDKEKIFPLLKKWGFNSLIAQLKNNLENEKEISEKKNSEKKISHKEISDKNSKKEISNKKDKEVSEDSEKEIYQKKVFDKNILNKNSGNKNISQKYIFDKEEFEVLFNFEKIKKDIKEEIYIFFEDNYCEILIGNRIFKGELNNESIKYLSDIFSNEKILKNGYDLKNLIKFLFKFNIELKGINFDIKIASWLLNPDIKKYGLERIFNNFFPELISHFSSLPFCFSIKKITEKQEEKIKELELENVFREIELPLINVLAKMENRGISINSKHFKKLEKEISKEISQLEKEIYEFAGEKFNISSPKQISEILFIKLKISTKGLRKTPGGVISTQEKELEKIISEHLIVERIMKHRELSKLQNTYIESLPKEVSKETGKIHTNFNQVGTATGRLSSESPNLQNIPVQGNWAKRIRKGFIPEKGKIFLSMDYSQIDLRVAASLSDDKKMIEAFKQNKDIHSITAAEINNIEYIEITSEMRRQAKVLNFGILYGMGWRAFSQNAKISKEQAIKFIEEYFKNFSSIKNWQESIKNSARKNGFVQTLTGRKRWVSDINSGNQKYRAMAERIAINFPVQGLSADIIKIAMNKINQFLKKEKLEEKIYPILQIHDELIFEVEEDYKEKAEELLKNIMENSYILKNVKLKVSSEFGRDLIK
jgi:DNA polymerase-1